MQLPQVSILVLVDLAFESELTAAAWEPVPLVSILVLVDLAFEYSFLPISPMSPCFNPFLSGLASNMEETGAICIYTTVFNPFLSGFASNHFSTRGQIEVSEFNPCFSGSCFRILRIRVPFQAFQFQSLFT